jgi:dTDP-glucose pyrophosphorylase
MPMAGRGQRFVDAGFTSPKPLIPIFGHPMTKVVIANLQPAQEHRFIFLILKEHADAFGFDKLLREWVPGCTVLYVQKVTKGAACTALLAKDFINKEEPLMIANCDQWVDVVIDDYLDTMQDNDGLIMTMYADDPKWSYVRFDGEKIVEVVEKKVVSNCATVGIYNFAKGKDFVWAAERMIAKNIRVNNEFYVAPCYNQLLEAGKKLTLYNVGREGAGLYGLGIPSDLEKFIKNPIATKAIAQI